MVIALLAVVFTLTSGGGGTAAAPQFAPDRQVTFSGEVGKIGFAPDGRTATYVTADRGTIVLQDLDGGGSQPVYAAPTGMVIQRAEWSADGSRIVFGVLGTGLRIMSIPRLGGEARLEMDLSHLLNLNGLEIFPAGPGEWIVSSDRRMYVGADPASLRIDSGLMAGPGVFPMREEGSRAQAAAASHDGSWVAYSSPDSLLVVGTSIVSRDGKTGPGRIAAWAGLRVCGWTADDSGIYLYRAVGNALDLLRAPVDRRTGRPTGPPVLVYPRLADAADLHISRDGRRLLLASGPTSTRIRVLDLDRTPDPADNPQTALSRGTAAWLLPSWLPDGRIAVLNPVEGGYDLLAVSRGGDSPQLLAQRRGHGIPIQSLNPSPDGRSFALVEQDSDQGLKSVITLVDAGSGRERVIALPEPASGVAWSADGRHLGAMTSRSADRALTVDVESGTARTVELNCGDRCEFAYESIAIGPDWPLAAVSSQNDVWIVNLETGAIRLLAPDGWFAVAWIGDWVYFTRRAGQTGERRTALFRVRASGKPEERLLDFPAECQDDGGQTISPDGRTVACGEVTVRRDLHVIDGFDPAVAKP